MHFTNKAIISLVLPFSLYAQAQHFLSQYEACLR